MLFDCFFPFKQVSLSCLAALAVHEKAILLTGQSVNICCVCLMALSHSRRWGWLDICKKKTTSKFKKKLQFEGKKMIEDGFSKL